MAFSWGDRLPTLTGPHLTLRHLTTADAGDLFAIFSDPQVTRYWSTGPMATTADAAAYIGGIHSSLQRRELFQWGLEHGVPARIIGTCTLFNVSTIHQRAEIGFALARSFWGRGLAREALVALLAFAFAELNVHRVEADADPRNERSIRLLERLGFRREGILRERYLVSGERQDALMLGLLRREWEDATRATPLPTG